MLAVALACGRDSTEQPASVLPQRIVSQTVLSDEVLFALGSEVQARVVGVSRMADDELYSGVVSRWRADVPRIPGTSELMLASEPDLVIVAEFTDQETRALLRNAGVRTLVLSGFDGFADYRLRVAEIAEAVGAKQAGQALVRSFDVRLAEVEQPAANGPTIVSWTEGLVPGRGTTFADEAVAAGFRNLPGIHGLAGHARVSIETVVGWDPEFIAVSCGPITCPDAERQLAERAGFSSTRAAKAGRIVGVPAAQLFSTGAGMLGVVEILVDRRRKAAQP